MYFYGSIFSIYFLFIFSSFCFLSVQAQNLKNDSIQSFLDQAMHIIEANSIHTENLDHIKPKLYKNSKNLNSLDESLLYLKRFLKLK